MGKIITVFLLAITLTALFLSQWYSDPRDPVAAFAEDFDTNLKGAPIAAEAVRDDPRLRNLLLERSKSAYIRGGWPAANTEMRFVLASYVAPYADNEHIRAIAIAGLAVDQALQATPTLCRSYALSGSTPEIEAVAKTEMAALSAAHWAAVENGARRKRAGAVWRNATYGEWRNASAEAMVSPTPLSAEEARAYDARMTSGASPVQVEPAVAVAIDAALLCRAIIGVDRNILALPDAEGARIQRIFLSGVASIDWLSLRAAARAQEKATPAKAP